MALLEKGAEEETAGPETSLNTKTWKGGGRRTAKYDL